MFDLVHAGFDTIDVAIQGALPPQALKILEYTRDKAAERQEVVLAHIGPSKVAMHVSGHGLKGGYAFVVDTGPLGAKWMFKNNADPNQWNVFVSPRATMLLACGYEGTRDRLWWAFKAMGGMITNHSINRVDFAMDFRTHGFELCQDQFVAHSHAKVSSYWGKELAQRDRNQPSAVIRGRRLESVTIGKMPGRQVIVYDKRREAIERQKGYWFKAWGVDPKDPTVEIWRIEVRAGKTELKDKWQIRRFGALEYGIGDVCTHALSEVRYLADMQSDSNVTRQQLHPLWIAAQTAAASNLLDFRSGLVPGQVIEIERKVAQERYAKLVVGNAVGLGVALGLSDEEITTKLPALIATKAKTIIDNDPPRLTKAIKRARGRLHFVAKPDEATTNV